MVFCRGCGKQLHETALACPNCGAQQVVDLASSMDIRSQTAAGLWCFFLGAFGAHWFYLRKNVAGVLSLLFCWTGIPSIVAFINGIQIAYANQNDWARKWNNGVQSAPAHVAVKVLVIAGPLLGLLFWISVFSALEA